MPPGGASGRSVIVADNTSFSQVNVPLPDTAEVPTVWVLPKGSD